jgi:hypothetical protein
MLVIPESALPAWGEIWGAKTMFHEFCTLKLLERNFGLRKCHVLEDTVDLEELDDVDEVLFDTE